jgi:uncharacterized protein (DUF2252 family)
MTMTVDSLASGKAARSRAPRASHAELGTRPGDRDPVTILEAQALDRVAELVPVRYGRMLVSPFTFYRGAAAIMAADLADSPRSGIMAQLCGDAHLLNFGVFGSPERRLVFDINDFDETARGPWEWDVKRLAASFEIAGRDREFSGKERRSTVLAAVQGYRSAMAEFAGMRHIEVFYASLDLDAIMTLARAELRAPSVRKVQKMAAASMTRDSLQAQRKLTRLVKGRRLIVSQPPLIVPIEQVLPDDARRERFVVATRESVRDYRSTLEPASRQLLDRYSYGHMARKVVGVGSVGTRCWILLMHGDGPSDPLLLQVKQAMPSVLAPFTNNAAEPAQPEGERVVVGQKRIQATTDIFLGWVRGPGTDGVTRDFYIRQLRDWKGSAEISTMVPRGMRTYARLCGWTLARAHARTADRTAIAAYLGKGTSFDEAIARFAVAYADQNERDYATFAAAVASGRLTAQRGL